MKSLPRCRLFKLSSVAIVIAMLAVLLASAVGSFQGARAADGFPLYGDVTVNTDRLNIRATPGIDGIVTAVIPFGTLLAVEAGPTSADGYDWYQITRLDVQRDGEGGPDGWVAGDFLTQYGYAPGTELQVTDGPVYLRDGSSTKTAILESLAQATHMTVLTGPLPYDGYTWYQVIVDDGARGWVAGEFLGAADGGGDGGNGGYGAGDAVIVIDGPLNLRTTPSITGEISRVVPTGATFSTSSDSVDADGYTWISVFSVGYGKGWVASDFIALDPAGTGGGEDNGGSGGGFQGGDAVKVSDGPLNLRETPALDGAVIALLPQDARFFSVTTDAPVTVDGYTWVNIYSPKYGRGWVAADFIAIDPNSSGAGEDNQSPA